MCRVRIGTLAASGVLNRTEIFAGVGVFMDKAVARSLLAHKWIKATTIKMESPVGW